MPGSSEGLVPLGRQGLPRQQRSDAGGADPPSDMAASRPDP
jgi:hypothetical protein